MIAVTDSPIDVSRWLERLDTTGAGSVVAHVGIVKPDPEGRPSSGMTFARDGDLEAELRGIEAYVREHLRVADVLLVRRLGRLAVGDLIFLGAVAAHDRVNAFAACRELVERCKKLRHLTKEEHFVESP